MCICTYMSACSVTVEIVGTGRLAAEIMAVITAKVNSPHALGSGPLEECLWKVLISLVSSGTNPDWLWLILFQLMQRRLKNCSRRCQWPMMEVNFQQGSEWCPKCVVFSQQPSHCQWVCSQFSGKNVSFSCFIYYFEGKNLMRLKNSETANEKFG